MPMAKSEITKASGQHTIARRGTSVNKSNDKRRYPIGAEVIGEKETHFRVWAPKANQVEVVMEGNESGRGAERRRFELEKEKGGYFSGSAPANDGDLYRFRLDA